MIYLATPYSHPDPAVVLDRYHKVNKLAAELFAKGLFVYSPISHSHPIAEAGGLPVDWSFWQAYDTYILRHCTKLLVYCQDGWDKSVGVQAEIEIAEELGLDIEFYRENN